MKLNVWLIAVIGLIVCVGSSFQDELELDDLEDAPVQDEAQELEDDFEDEENDETDLEDPTKVRRPFCPKFLRLKCIIFKNCGKLRRFCTCVRRYYGDEAENDDQVNDVIEEDGAEEVEETKLEDPSKRLRRCLPKLLPRCFLVKVGYRKRRFCVCVRRCYSDEPENDNEVSDEFPDDKMDEDYEDLEEMSDSDNEEAVEEDSALEDPGKIRRRRCPRYSRRRCFIIKRCKKRRRVCTCVRRRYGDEPENDIELNDETEDEPEELEETSIEDPTKGRRLRRCPGFSRRECFISKRGKKKRRLCICVRPCYGDEPAYDV